MNVGFAASAMVCCFISQAFSASQSMCLPCSSFRPSYLRTISQRKGKYEKASESHCSFFLLVFVRSVSNTLIDSVKLLGNFSNFDELYEERPDCSSIWDWQRTFRALLGFLGQICLTLTCIDFVWADKRPLKVWFPIDLGISEGPPL